MRSKSKMISLDLQTLGKRTFIATMREWGSTRKEALTFLL